MKELSLDDFLEKLQSCADGKKWGELEVGMVFNLRIK